MLDCKIQPATVTQKTFGFSCWAALKVTNISDLICQFYSMGVNTIFIQIKIKSTTFYIFFKQNIIFF